MLFRSIGTKAPTTAPIGTKAPTTAPIGTKASTTEPTKAPIGTKAPTTAPFGTKAPSTAPTLAPIGTKAPTNGPTKMLTKVPSKAPTLIPSKYPTLAPVFPIYVIFNATFDEGSDLFSYQDDGFRGSSRPPYANAFTETTIEYRGVIGVKLSWIDNVNVTSLSGGWSRIFTLANPRNVAISITYQLEQSAEYEGHELSQALCSIDGVLIANTTGVDYLAQIQGDGDGGPSIVVGFTTTTINVSLSAGAHTILIGGYVSSRSDFNEVTWIRYDEVIMTAL